jgi:hypothetical protein
MIDFIARRHFTRDSMTRDFTMTLPLKLTNPLNGAQGFSRGAAMGAARVRKTQRETTRWSIMAALRAEGVRLPVDVTITRVAPRRLDDDGLSAAAKSVRDGIADAFGIPDNDPRISWRYDQAKGEPKQYATRITIAQRPA